MPLPIWCRFCGDSLSTRSFFLKGFFVKKKHSLRTTLFRMMIIPTSAVVLILAGVILLSFQLVQDEIIARQRLSVNNLARQGDQYLAETTRLMGIVADSIGGLSPTQQQKLLVNTRLNYPRFTVMYLLDQSGYVLLEDGSTYLQLDPDQSDEEFFVHVHLTGLPYFSDPFLSLSTEQISAKGAMPVFFDDKIQSVLVGELNLELLQKAIEQVYQDEDSVSFIVDQHGRAIA